MELMLMNKVILTVRADTVPSEVKRIFCRHIGVIEDDFYLLQNGKIVDNGDKLASHRVHAVPRVLGGKGGFGSMLRAIGAQIEKTTNREACRDLSGRRLRDINEEKRLKNWIAQQAEREKEAAERKIKKLQRLCQKPTHEFNDKEYDKERSELPEKLEDAVSQGFEAAASSHVKQKRKHVRDDKIKKKKPKLWVDADVEDDLSTSDEDISSDEDCSKPEAQVELLKSSAASLGTSVDAMPGKDNSVEEENDKQVDVRVST